MTLPSRPCPRCQNPLEIPKDLPPQLQCSKCGATIKLRAEKKAAAPLPEAIAIAEGPPPAAAEIGVAHEASGPSGRGSRGVLWGAVAALVLTASVLAVFFVFRGLRSDEGLREQVDLTPVEQPPPGPDPRIKIVQPAVDKGVVFLKKVVPALGAMRPGYAGLSGLALLECGVPPDDPHIVKIADHIRAGAPSMQAVYDLASSLFFLNRLDDLTPLNDKNRKMARSFALRIIAGQLTSGIWGYGGVIMTPEQETKLLASLKDGTFKPSTNAVASMSNTQFAMLAVWGSRRHGIQVRDPLLAMAAYLHANQFPDGHWVYPGHSLAATSTCAALMCLAMESVILDDPEFAAKPPKEDAKKKYADVSKGFAFVGKTVGRKKGDPGGGAATGYGGAFFDADGWSDLYFLWTLERLGVIYSREKIGGRDWYDWGYPIVLAAQQPDGSFVENHTGNFGPIIHTSFALLFLKRANIAKDLTDKLQVLQGSPTVSSQAPPVRKE